MIIVLFNVPQDSRPKSTSLIVMYRGTVANNSVLYVLIKQYLKPVLTGVTIVVPVD